MYTQIAVSRNLYAKQHQLLTYSAKSHQPSTDRAQSKFEEYVFHPAGTMPILPMFKWLPEFARRLRFRFGELAWSALSWYVQNLKFPKRMTY